MNDRRVKCRFCDWSAPVFWKNKSGKASSGFDALKRHVDDAHEAEAVAIEQRLDAERDARRPITRIGTQKT